MTTSLLLDWICTLESQTNILTVDIEILNQQNGKGFCGVNNQTF